jgi:hypothetical protein
MAILGKHIECRPMRLAERRRTVDSPATCPISGERRMLRYLVAASLLVMCAACGGNGDDPAPSSPTTSTPSAPPSSSSPNVPSYLATYSAEQQTAYEEAVAAYEKFLTKNDRFFATGKTTVGALNFYRRYAIDWSTAWGNLGQVANNDATIAGSTRTIWTRPKSIRLDPTRGDTVVIRRCLDESNRVVTQNGNEIPQPQFKTPHVYTVRIQKRLGEGWWRFGIADQGKTC